MYSALMASVFVASLSLLGAFLFRKHSHITGTHRFIIPVALGMFLGIVFFELIPETLAANEMNGSFAIVVGFLSFYLLSHLLKTYHHHHHDNCHDCSPKGTASLLLVGDAIHNISDGVIIATAFIINPTVGIITTIGIALHEIPQEIAEFGILLQSGYSRTRAAFYNLLSASSIIVGVLLSYLFLSFGDYLWILTGLAAGNLLYIAAADMIPELHGHAHRDHFASTFMSTIAGLALIIFLLNITHSEEPHEKLETEPIIENQIAN